MENKLFGSQVEIIAEMIHSIMCNANHTDGCGWYYTNWNDRGTSPYTARNIYLEKAQAVFATNTSYLDAYNVLAALGGSVDE